MSDPIWDSGPKKDTEIENLICSCMSDPFKNLIPELRPRPKDVMNRLHKLKCPACGFEYWTNRATGLCIDCEKKGIHLSTT